MFLMFLPICVYAVEDTVPPLLELDTVWLGGSLPIVVHPSEAMVSMSYRTFEDIGSYVRIQDKELVYYRQQWEYCRESQGWADLEIEERMKVSGYYKDRSIMYKEGYDQMQEDFLEFNDLLQEKNRIILDKGRGQLWRGGAVGVSVGVAVGLIVGFIITR